MEDIGSEAIEIDSLENYLLQAEYIYKSDITLLQKALIRTKRIENLHLIGLQARMTPILSKFIRLQLHCFFFKWKSEILIESTNRQYLLGTEQLSFFQDQKMRNIELQDEKNRSSTFLGGR